MSRTKSINPTGTVKFVGCNIPSELADDIRREAKSRGVTFAQVMRDRLACNCYSNDNF